MASRSAATPWGASTSTFEDIEMQNHLIEVPTTMSSLEIANLTDKEHRNVTRDIEKMLSDIHEDALKFERIYQDSYGRDQKEYQLPKDMTLTLITGYRADIRHKVIKRWMELEGDYVSMTLAEQALFHAQRLVDHERRVKAIEAQQAEDHASLTALVNGENYFTVIGYANVTGRKFDAYAATRIGKAATALCNEHGWQIGQAPHPRFGMVNTYPREALDEILQSMKAA